MRRPLSLTLRLTLLFGIAAVLVFTGFGWLIEGSLQRHFVEGDTSELETITHAVDLALVTHPSKEDLASLQRRFDDILVGHHSASLRIVGRAGQTIYASPEPDLSGLVPQSNHGGSVQNWSDGKRHYRVLIRRIGTTPIANHKAYTIVAIPIAFHLGFLDNFRHTLWLMVASGVAITSLMGWVAVRQGHAPLRDIVTQIRQISANELNTRLAPEAVPKELAHLAISFNEMLSRMEEAFLRLSNFSADIAHDLRTPITNLMTQTQVTLAQTRTVEEYQETLYSNMEEYERLAQMINDMLFLARADHGLGTPNVSHVDLATEVNALFEFYEAWAEERGVMLALEGEASVAGDRLMLRRALANLLSNAINHSPADKNVRVTLSTTSPKEVSIVVENHGPQIPPEHLAKLFDRFYRVDPARQEGGSGLGLAIVKSIITAHGGKIEITSTTDQTRLQVTLPSVS